MEFVQRNNYYKPDRSGVDKIFARNVPIRICIDDNDIVGVQEVINSNTGKPYKKICRLHLMNYMQYDNQLVVNYPYQKMKIMLDQRFTSHIRIKGFGK
jgi:hypothetical protein